MGSKYSRHEEVGEDESWNKGFYYTSPEAVTIP
jgi:hypothetical protein